jgi:MFS family permease
MRILQAVGGAMLFANATAILTDAVPADHRGMARGLNQVAGIAGQFVGLILGGLLGPVEWHLVFLVSVPFGVFGTFWAYRKLGERRPVHFDWRGNLTFGAGLTALLAGITYGIQPYGGYAIGPATTASTNAATPATRASPISAPSRPRHSVAKWSPNAAPCADGLRRPAKPGESPPPSTETATLGRSVHRRGRPLSDRTDCRPRRAG